MNKQAFQLDFTVTTSGRSKISEEDMANWMERTMRFGAMEKPLFLKVKEVPPPEVDVDITVNGLPAIAIDNVTYAQATQLAFGREPAEGEILTITYSAEGISGSLSPGKSVRPRPGMVFTVADTSNA